MKQLHKEAGVVEDARFHIVSIALESNREQWERAVDAAGLDWAYHIGQMDLFDSKLAQLYGIRQIPTKILIDREGHVVAVNPSFDEIRSTVF